MSNKSFQSILSIITKALKQTIYDVLNVHLTKYGTLYNDEINVLKVLAKLIRERINKRFGKAFRSIPFKGKKLEKFMELELLGVRVFRFFDEEKELYINDDDLYEIIMSCEEFEEYKNILLKEHESEDEDEL